MIQYSQWPSAWKSLNPNLANIGHRSLCTMRCELTHFRKGGSGGARQRVAMPQVERLTKYVGLASGAMSLVVWHAFMTREQ